MIVILISISVNIVFMLNKIVFNFSSSHKSSRLSDLINYDVLGPTNVSLILKSMYLLSFINDYNI